MLHATLFHGWHQISYNLPFLQDLFISGTLRCAGEVMADPSHTGHKLFETRHHYKQARDPLPLDFILHTFLYFDISYIVSTALTYEHLVCVCFIVHITVVLQQQQPNAVVVNNKKSSELHLGWSQITVVLGHLNPSLCAPLSLTVTLEGKHH